MTTYNSFIEQILLFFATPHLQIKRFEEGFYQDMSVWMTTNEDWPIMWVVPQEITHLTNSVSEYSLRVYFLDLLEKDESNERDVLSDQQQSARDFTNWIRENKDNGLNLLRDPRTLPVKSIGMDFTAGWYSDVSLEIDTEGTECAIPFTGSFPPAAPFCTTFEAISDIVFGCIVGDVVSIIGYAPTGTPTSEDWNITYNYIAVDGTVTAIVQTLPWDDRLNSLSPCPGGYLPNGYLIPGYVLP